MAKRLFIDLNKCDACEECTVTCVGSGRAEAADRGMLALRELAAFAVVCRRCEEPDCAAACKYEALERQTDGMMKRYNMRCVSCKSCSHACPFGIIYPETLPFYVVPCDFCARVDDEKMPCAIACVKQAVEFRDVEESPKEGIFLVGERLAVKAPRWNKKDG